MAETRKAARRLLKQLVRSGRYVVATPGRLAQYARGTTTKSVTVGSNDSGLDQAEVKEYLAALLSCKLWLRNNPDAKASVERGLEQAASGQGRYLGTFAKYADLEIEED